MSLQPQARGSFTHRLHLPFLGFWPLPAALPLPLPPFPPCQGLRQPREVFLCLSPNHPIPPLSAWSQEKPSWSSNLLTTETPFVFFNELGDVAKQVLKPLEWVFILCFIPGGITCKGTFHFASALREPQYQSSPWQRLRLLSTTLHLPRSLSPFREPYGARGPPPAVP